MEISPQQLEVIKSVMAAPDGKPKKLKGVAKLVTIGVLVLSFLGGFLGSFSLIPFDVPVFIEFLKVFFFPFSLLIFSIGVNSVLSTQKEKKNDKETVGKN